jgi:predicted MPP superfamily phosphohydrolase
MNAPDHGFWAHAENRLYVHRGTGHYGFPLRLGVPAEESLLRVHPLRTEPSC